MKIKTKVVNNLGELRDLSRNVEDRLRKKASKAASRIADELTEEARSAIDYFYNVDYPSSELVIYKRSDEGAGSMVKSYTRYRMNKHSHIYHGGVTLIDPGPRENHGKWHGHSIDSDWLFMEVWLSGRHGRVENFPHAKKIPPIMSPTPYERVKMKRDEILENLDEYLN